MGELSRQESGNALGICALYRVAGRERPGGAGEGLCRMAKMFAGWSNTSARDSAYRTGGTDA